MELFIDASIYARLSRNRAGISDSVEIQMAEGRGYIDDQGWLIALTRSDDDISASKFTTKPRPGYDSLLEAVRSNLVEVIVVTEMSRLYRRLEELLSLIKLAETTRLKAIWTTDGEGFDLSTPEGIHRAIGAVNNSMLESAKISKRVKRKKASQAKDGLPSGGNRAFGYEPGNLIVREVEAAVLRECRDRFIAGATIRDLVRDLNKRGIPTAYGKPWRIENLQRTLLKKRYIGIRVHNGVEYPAAWPGIFTEEDWHLMEARRISRAWKGPQHSSGYRTYLLTGYCYCGRCGGLMYGSRRPLPNGTMQRRYRCRMYDNNGNQCGCGRMYRGADPLETLVTEAVFYRFDSPEVVKLLSASDEQPDVTGLIATYQQAKERVEQMVHDYATGLLSREQFAVAKVVAEGEMERAKTELVKSRKTPNLPVGIEALREVWDTAGLDWRRDVIRLLVEKVIVHEPVAHQKRSWRGWRFQPDAIEICWVS